MDMSKEIYAVITGDIDADSGHYGAGDVLHISKLIALAEETKAPIECVVVFGFDNACEWSDCDGF